MSSITIGDYVEYTSVLGKHIRRYGRIVDIDNGILFISHRKGLIERRYHQVRKLSIEEVMLKKLEGICF